MKLSEITLSITLPLLSMLGIGCSETHEKTITPITVHVQAVKPLDGSRTFAYSGTIEAFDALPLSFSVNGTVHQVLVSEGEYVRKDQLLALLNDVTMRNAFDAAQATLVQAEDAYARLRPMYENGTITEIRFVEAESDLTRARAAAAIARKNLDDCQLLSPVDGYVGTRTIEPGMGIAPGVPAIHILNIDSVYARISIPEDEIAQIAHGEPASVTVAALGSEERRGVINKIGVLADQMAHTYSVKITLPNRDHAVKPGMICEVIILLSDDLTSIAVPGQAVQIDETGRHYVFCINPDSTTVDRKFIETGRLLADGIEVVSGLTAGEQVVVSGQHKLVHGAQVEILP